jgi:hypothetical protein
VILTEGRRYLAHRREVGTRYYRREGQPNGRFTTTGARA